ncbi:MAG TPA: hypothetical protein VIG30_10495 [Ktedonobacterales bacterium]
MRHSPRSVTALFVLVLPAIFLLVACGGSPAASGAAGTGVSSLGSSAKATICQSLATVNQSLSSLANVGDSTTVGTVKATQAKVATTLNKVVALVPGAVGSILGQVQSANDDLGKQLQGYSDSTTIGNTSVNVQGIKSKVSAVQGKTTLLSSTLKCSA